MILFVKDNAGILFIKRFVVAVREGIGKIISAFKRTLPRIVSADPTEYRGDQE